LSVASIALIIFASFFHSDIKQFVSSQLEADQASVEAVPTIELLKNEKTIVMKLEADIKRHSEQIVKLEAIDLPSANEWSFDSYMLSIAKRASRLHRDFDIEWSSISLCLDMIEELEKLRSENKTLKQRLGRFLLE